MARLLQELPRPQYSYRLDVPKLRDGKPKSRRVQHIGKYGELTYTSKRRKGKPLKLKHTSDMLQYEVWCTVCFDAGCDSCPPYPEGDKP